VFVHVLTSETSRLTGMGEENKTNASGYCLVYITRRTDGLYLQGHIYIWEDTTWIPIHT